MGGNSRQVISGQTGVHEDLARTVLRHLASPFQRPVSGSAQAAFDLLLRHRAGQALIFDSGCGVGDSTRRLAQRHPEALVVGIDKSSDRLSRHRPAPLPDNALLLRADLIDFWRLAAAHGVRLARHYLLYPNPWPKIGHLQRRWHGHAVFPDLLRLGGVIELRTNWGLYAEEFAQAVGIHDAGRADPAAARAEFRELAEVEILLAQQALTSPLTPFELKYAQSGQTLYRVLIPRPEVQADSAGLSLDRS